MSTAAKKGVKLVLFPEAFIPAYPRGLTFGMRIGSRSQRGRKLWQMYYDNAISVPGPTVEQLAMACHNAGVSLAIGVVEKEFNRNGGTLYCTLLIFGADGRLIVKHRKLKPTGAERMIWGEGDGDDLAVHDSDVGRIGGLICWENYMPLARMALYEQGVEIYLAPTADARDAWQHTLKHIALEGRCFVLGCNQFVTRDMYPPPVIALESLRDQPEIMCRGGSVIISPMGETLAGPLFDEEGILYADLDLSEIARARLDFDVAGHYARPDVFDFKVKATD